MALISGGLLSAALVTSSVVWLGAAQAAPAKGKAAAAPAAPNEQQSRAVGELAGKYKWGMSHEEVMGVIDKEITAKFDPRIREAQEAEKQDLVRKEMKDQMAEVRKSYIIFNGQKTGWDVSIVDREYGHKNGESMLVIWEAQQRRFLFFWNDKLYKQFIALNAEKFKGKTFEDFAEAMQVRYGKAEVTFAKQQTADEMALDYYQFPPSGDFILRALDQTSFYGNFCLVLLQKSVYEQVEKERAKNSPPRVRHTSVRVVDTVMGGDSMADPNESVVDDLVGKRAVPSVESKRIHDRILKANEADKNQAPKK